MVRWALGDVQGSSRDVCTCRRLQPAHKMIVQVYRCLQNACSVQLPGRVHYSEGLDRNPHLSGLSAGSFRGYWIWQEATASIICQLSVSRALSYKFE